MSEQFSEIVNQLVSFLERQEMNPARIQNEQLGNMEFSQAVAPYLDPKDRKYIDPEHSKVVPLSNAGDTYINLQGTNLKGWPESYQEIIKLLPWMHAQGKTEEVLEGGNIYALGAKNAHPALWAHEYRHQSPQVAARIFYELANRQEDAVHAQTPFDVEWARENLRDFLLEPDKFFTGKTTNDRVDRAIQMKQAEHK